MDVEGGMKGNIYEAMGDAVCKAAIVIPLLTSKYQLSKYCQKELQTAESNNVVLLPVKLERFEEQPWLKFILSGLKYFRINDAALTSQADVDAFHDLLKTVHDKSPSSLLVNLNVYFNSSTNDVELSTRPLPFDGLWTFVSTLGKILDSSQLDSVPLYEFYSSGFSDHYYSTNETPHDDSWKFNKLVGYLPKNKTSHTADICEYYCTTKKTHWFCVNGSPPLPSPEEFHESKKMIFAYIFPAS
jgi:hypothetical protein